MIVCDPFTLLLSELPSVPRHGVLVANGRGSDAARIHGLAW
jgi:hypothetical protein